MASKKNVVVEIETEDTFDVNAYMMEMVEIPPLFYDKDKYSAPVPVGLNGVMYLIPRGVSGLKVPRAVKNILDSSEFQEKRAGNFMRSIEGVKSMGDFT